LIIFFFIFFPFFRYRRQAAYRRGHQLKRGTLGSGYGSVGSGTEVSLSISSQLEKMPEIRDGGRAPEVII